MIGIMAYALGLESVDSTAWRRADGSVRTDYRRAIRGVTIEVRIEQESWHPDAFAILIHVRTDDAGLVYEEFFDRRTQRRRVTVMTPGDWERVLRDAFHDTLSAKKASPHGRP